MPKLLLRMVGLTLAVCLIADSTFATVLNSQQRLPSLLTNNYSSQHVFCDQALTLAEVGAQRYSRTLMPRVGVSIIGMVIAAVGFIGYARIGNAQVLTQTPP